MPCYHPIEGYRSRFVNASGKRSIVFNKRDGFVDLKVNIPCGQCIGCRLEKSRQWAMRCVHEASLHDANCFITLTYDDDNLPVGYTLVKKHFQDFMKRLRWRFPQRISYFACGEYGEILQRPHYHACLFGFDFPDKAKLKQVGDNLLYRSLVLEELWPFGFCTIGSVSFDSAAYCARYVMKKVTGDRAERHYESILRETGEIVRREPEFALMSLRPAIGKLWYNRFNGEVLASDSVVMRGKEMNPPKYYDKLHEREDELAHSRVKWKRIRKAKKHADNNTPERLLVREVVAAAKVNLLKREL